jgi:hypothetical protein
MVAFCLKGEINLPMEGGAMGSTLPRSVRIPSLALTVTLLASLQAWAMDCQVNPRQAYDIAVQRGWNFMCVHDGHVGSADPPLPGTLVSSGLLLEMNRVGCIWRTGPVPSPSPPVVRLAFFEGMEMRNGWSINQALWELTGGQYNKEDSPHVRATTSLPHHDTTFRYRLSKLILSKPKGNCLQAIDEAF